MSRLAFKIPEESVRSFRLIESAITDNVGPSTEEAFQLGYRLARVEMGVSDLESIDGKGENWREDWREDQRLVLWHMQHLGIQNTITDSTRRGFKVLGMSSVEDEK